MHSQYLTQMGSCKVFSEKMEALIENHTTRQVQTVFMKHKKSTLFLHAELEATYGSLKLLR
jgi:hypothetical protein